MADKVSYLGIKAVSKTGEEVYYSPIEIATLFGKWSTVNFVHKATMVGVLVVVVCGLAICVRRSARQGYRPLE
jgi:thiosulfate reductase cytochrome b subunit